MSDWPAAALRRLYPPRCQLCGRAGDNGLDLCRGCRSDLPYSRDTCAVCASPLAETGNTASPVCGDCQKKPPEFDLCRAPFSYQGAIPYLIHSFKFHGRLAAGRLLGLLLADWLAHQIGPRPQLLVPVPLHASRLRQRGYNQAAELAHLAGRRFGIPVALRAAIRIRATPPQVDLPRAKRLHNLRGAFSANLPADVIHVGIVDDVVTTGATTSELARVIKRAGATRVEVWAIARTDPKTDTALAAHP